MKVYTKSGDGGTTSLVGGERVPKSDERVEAYGTVDELMAFTALLTDRMRHTEALAPAVGELEQILSRLMGVAALLATGKGAGEKVAPLGAEPVAWLEERIDAMQAQLPPITKFTLPGGNESVSLCHVCRTVCRRAERAALRAAALHEIPADVLAYLNRLSDYFYLLGRTTTARLNVEERLWIP